MATRNVGIFVEKICNFFDLFHSSGSIPVEANSSFIVLIPKKSNARSISDFHLISPINCSIILLLKVMSNRIKPILSKIISETQTAFVKGRNITESILMVDEIIHSMRVSKIDGLIVKLDFSKAYDSVDWSCLLHAMSCLKFGDKWISWIKVLLYSVRTLIMVNGSPTEEFTP